MEKPRIALIFVGWELSRPQIEERKKEALLIGIPPGDVFTSIHDDRSSIDRDAAEYSLICEAEKQCNYDVFVVCKDVNHPIDESIFGLARSAKRSGFYASLVFNDGEGDREIFRAIDVQVWNRDDAWPRNSDDVPWEDVSENQIVVPSEVVKWFKSIFR